MVGDLGMEIAHLRVILNTEGILHISANAETKFIHSYDSISCWAFEYV
jgi:hypothetical protein